MKKQEQSWVKRARIIMAFSVAIAVVLAATVIYSCTKNTGGQSPSAGGTQPNLKVNTAQPLPGGRAYFTAAVGRFQTSPGTACYVRVVNYTFNAAAGSVSADLYEWKSTSQFGKTTFTNHTCSVDGPSKTCTQYSPTGWIVGTSTNPTAHWTCGVYTYNTTTGALHIDWPCVQNAYEDWTISANVGGKPFSQMAFVGSSANYPLTDAYGFGSNQPFTTYKTVNNVPHIDMSGHNKSCVWNGSDPLYTVGGGPQDQFFSSMGFVTGGNAIHMKVGAVIPPPCTSSCYPGSTKTGIIYHLTSLNNSRMMAYDQHCACLPDPGTYPCYNGTIHPYAMMQVIDDNGAMQGLVGIQEQDEPGSSGFNYSINYWLYP